MWPSPNKIFKLPPKRDPDLYRPGFGSGMHPTRHSTANSGNWKFRDKTGKQMAVEGQKHHTSYEVTGKPVAEQIR